MALRFGISTWFLSELSVAEAIESIASSGYQAAEVWMEHLLRTGERPDSIKETARRAGLELTLHAPSYDLNPTSINRGIREESLRQLELTIRTGAALDARAVVVHPGRLSTGRASVTAYWEELLHCFELLDGWAESAKVRVGVEAMERRQGELYVTAEDVRKMLDRGWKRIGLTLDVAHAFTHADPVAFIESVDSRWIVHVHLSDGAPGKTHLALGKGAIDIAAAIDALERRYDGIVSIEGYDPGKGRLLLRQNMSYLQALGWPR